MISRFHAGGIDISELPSGYKRADAVVRQISDYGLAEIEDYIDPFGCIMAGDLPPFAKTGRPGGSPLAPLCSGRRWPSGSGAAI